MGALIKNYALIRLRFADIGIDMWRILKDIHWQKLFVLQEHTTQHFTVPLV